MAAVVVVVFRLTKPKAVDSWEAPPIPDTTTKREFESTLTIESCFVELAERTETRRMWALREPPQHCSA